MVTFVSAPEASLQARENEIYIGVVTLLTIPAHSSCPLLYCTTGLYQGQKGSSTVSLKVLMKIYSKSKK